MLKKFRALFGAQDMTVGSPLSCLMKFAIPLLIGNMAQLLYTSVDAAVVGNYMGDLGDTALAAVGLSMPVYNFFLVLFIGVGSGVMVMVSQYFGARESERLSESVGNAITLIAIVSLFITSVSVPLISPVLKLLNTQPETFDMARSYLTILFLGAAGSGFYNVMSGILRGLGESVFPLFVLLGTVLLNVGLDILFVAGLGMGVSGAALATVISQFLSSIVCITKVLSMRDVVQIKPQLLKLKRSIVTQVMRLGVPNAVSMGIVFGSTIIIQSLVNKMGTDVTTAITVTVRLDAFAVLPSHTFGMVASTFTGQNIGANRMDRVRKGSYTVFLMCLVFTAVMVSSMLLFGRHMLGLFTQTEKIKDMGMSFIRLMAPAYLAMVVNQSLSGVMRGAGDSIGPMWISLAINVFLRIPLSFLIVEITRSELYPNGSPKSTFMALLIAMLVGCVITTLYYRAGKWRNKSIIKRA